VVIEVCAGREDFEALEAVRRHFDQVIAIQSIVMVQVRGNTEPRCSHECAPGSR
jgi:hypothetical protein